ncbi:AraC family transcriptional regulator [Klebsiella sp. P1CD1]|nr:AraC family transcriptional regulator [Klebsiella sp. P1CD1]
MRPLNIRISKMLSQPDQIDRIFFAHTGTGAPWNWGKPHKHAKAQLLYTVKGILHCETDRGMWIVPPQSALWIPGLVLHSVKGHAETQCYSFYITPDALAGLPLSCCTLAVSPLLRELLLKAIQFPALYSPESAEERLIYTLLDEIASARAESLSFPLPTEPRLQRLAKDLMDMPSEKTTKSEWAQRIGMSERSMSRQLMAEVGMSFRIWRRQLHVILALQWLMNGSSVKNVALRLGYENASGFVTMFRKSVGKPPIKYLTERTVEKVTPPVPAIILPAAQGNIQ